MRIVLLFLFTCFTLTIHANELNKIRALYFEAGKDSKKSEQLIKAIPEDKAVKDPLLKAYRGTALTISADNSMNPFEKLSVFNKGKVLLEDAIKTEPANTEMRFLRFSVQSECPSFLNYSMNIDEDKNHLLSHWKTFSQQFAGSIFLSEVRSYLKSSKKLSAEEKAKLS
jgi:hypothetical protein